MWFLTESQGMKRLKVTSLSKRVCMFWLATLLFYVKMLMLVFFSDMPMDRREEESSPLVIRDRKGSQRSSSSMASGLQVQLYYFPDTKDTTTIQISSGQISAEDVCIKAGEQCGTIAMCLSTSFCLLHSKMCPCCIIMFFSLCRNLTGVHQSFWFGICWSVILVSSITRVPLRWKPKGSLQS